MIAIFPEIINLVLNNNIEKLACAVRKYHAGAKPNAPRLDVSSLISNTGIQISHWDRQGEGGILAVDEAGKFRVSICLCADLPENFATKYLYSFLLGRFYLDLAPAIARSARLSAGFRIESSQWNDLAEGRSLEVDDKEDDWRPAHEFANALLLPKGMLKAAARKIRSEGELANFFGVGSSFLAARLQQIASDNAERGSPMTAAVMESAPREVSQMESQAPKSHTKTGSGEKTAIEGGLQRLRSLAQKLDPSVKIR